jgi:hypothetical protein
MNVAVGVVLVLGSWVSVDLGVDEGPQSDRSPAQAERSVPNADTPQPLPDETRPQRGAAPTEQQAYRRPQYMPVAPTDISAENAGGYPFLTPTEQPQQAIPGAYERQPTPSPPTAMDQFMRRPTRPMSSMEARRQLHYGRADHYGRQAYRSYVDYRIQQTQFRTADYQSPSSVAVRAAAARSRKPFTAIRQSPAISPYLNMFRLDDTDGIANNYSTLVRPEVRQLDTNVRYGGNIRSLENRNILQGAAIGQIGNATRSLQGRPSQDYYMNLSTFYPGFQR